MPRVLRAVPRLGVISSIIFYTKAAAVVVYRRGTVCPPRLYEPFLLRELFDHVWQDSSFTSTWYFETEAKRFPASTRAYFVLLLLSLCRCCFVVSFRLFLLSFVSLPAYSTISCSTIVCTACTVVVSSKKPLSSISFLSMSSLLLLFFLLQSLLSSRNQHFRCCMIFGIYSKCNRSMLARLFFSSAVLHDFCLLACSVIVHGRGT